MYAKLAKRTTDFFIRKQVIRESDRQVYEYSYEVLFSQSIYILLMLAIAVLFRSVWETLLFFGGFMVYRKICGGYHAGTYTRCHLLFAVNQLLFLLLLFFVGSGVRCFLAFPFAWIAVLITFFAAPVDHPNKPFHETERVRFKKFSRILSVLIAVVSVIVLVWDKNSRAWFCFSIGIFSASVSLLYAFWERRLHNEEAS